MTTETEVDELIRQVLEGIKTGKQGIGVTCPDALRAAIYIRGMSISEFAGLAGLRSRATLSSALAGQNVTPRSWRKIICTLVGTPLPWALRPDAQHDAVAA